MHRWTMRSLFLAAAAVLLLPAHAAAQGAPVSAPGTLGAGVSFLSDGRGIGVVVDYSRPFRTLANDKTLGWVVDFGYSHDDTDNILFEGGVNTIMLQGGVRVRGALNDRVSWHGQGLVGILRTDVSGDFDDLCDDVEDLIGDDLGCGGDTGIIFTPGIGIDYGFSDNAAVRAQLDIPIGEGGAATRFWVGISFRPGQ
jgi:hypothetical protein